MAQQLAPHRFHARFTIALTLLGMAAGGLAAADPAEVAAEKLNYEQHIRPLVAKHCWSCHGPPKQEGGLRLDSTAGWEEGGNSRRSLLAESPDENELLRRLRSPDDHTRMPLGATPLSPAEIDTLQRWLQAGHPWAGVKVEATVTWHDRWVQFLDALFLPDGTPKFDLRHLYPAGYAVAVLALITLILERCFDRARKRGKSRADMRGLAGLGAHFRPYGYLAALAGCALVGLTLHLQKVEREATETQKLLDVANARAASAGVPPDEKDRPLYIRPSAPFQFGGTFYRGNDERSPALYNGGFYRTAVFYLSLCDAQDQPVNLGDPLPTGQLRIKFVIERSKGTTPALFAKPMMANTILTFKAPQKGANFGDFPAEHFLQELTPDQRWQGLAPLPLEGPQSRTGDVYIISGAFDKEKVYHGSSHYMIHYDLKAVNGRLAADSQLWLAATAIPSSVIWTPTGRVSASEWLDFRPIPEIEGQNSTDAKLLGIPEHEKRLKSYEAPKQP